jgi:hypothetical protein
VDCDALKAVRRAELLARLELLDELIQEQAGRAEFVRRMGGDAATHEERSRLLTVTRKQYWSLLQEFLRKEPERNEDTGGAPPAQSSQE